MSDVFLQRDFDPPLTDEAFDEMLEAGAGCFGIYRVQWRQSLLSTDGRRMVCCFTAPDVESTRLALRQVGENAVPWGGTIHDSAVAEAPPLESANVVVERSFAEPVALEDVQALEDANAGCLEARDVAFVCTFFSNDRRRMVCLYRAPDAEAVREAQRMAKMPVDSVWSFRLKS